MEVLRPSLLIDYKFVSVNNESRNITVAWSCKLDLFIVLHPDPPVQPSKRKGGFVGGGEGGLVIIVQYFCTSAGISVAQSDWVIWQLSHLYCTSLPQTT